MVDGCPIATTGPIYSVKPAQSEATWQLVRTDAVFAAVAAAA